MACANNESPSQEVMASEAPSSLHQVPTEVLALCLEYLPTIGDMCNARLVCTQWGGNDDVSDLGGAAREALLALNGEYYFDTAVSPLFDHFGLPRPPLGKAAPLKLYMCLCGDQLEDLDLGLGTSRDYNPLLLYLAQYTPYLKGLRLRDLTGELPDYYPGHLESGCCSLSEGFFLNHSGNWGEMETVAIHHVLMHQQTLHQLTRGSMSTSLQSLEVIGGPGMALECPLLTGMTSLRRVSLRFPPSAHPQAFSKLYDYSWMKPEVKVGPAVTDLEWGLEGYYRLPPIPGTAQSLTLSRQWIVQENLSRIALLPSLKKLDLSSLTCALGRAKTSGFGKLLESGSLKGLVDLRVGMWISGDAEAQRIPKACPNLKVFAISRLPEDEQINAWPPTWRTTDPKWGKKMEQLHATINSALVNSITLTELYLPGPQLQWHLLDLKNGLAKRSLTVLGLYGLRLSTESEKRSFQNYLHTGPHVPLLEQLNLFACSGVTVLALDAVALRCNRLQKFYCSSPLSLNFFPDLAARNNCLTVLHISVGPLVQPLLDAVRVWAPWLQELRVTEDKAAGVLLPSLRAILHTSRPSNTVYRGGPPCAFSVGNSAKKDLEAAHEQFPGRHGDGWKDSAGNTITVDFTPDEQKEWEDECAIQADWNYCGCFACLGISDPDMWEDYAESVESNNRTRHRGVVNNYHSR